MLLMAKRDGNGRALLRCSCNDTSWTEDEFRM